MQSSVVSATTWGIEARPVRVEVDVRSGPPRIEILGLSAPAARESRERVRAAVKNAGYRLPFYTLVVQLAPSDLKKEPGHFDLGIALALLTTAGEVPAEALRGRVICGELGFDGRVRPVRGALAIAELAAREGASELIVPAANAGEAAVLGGVRVIPVRTLSGALDHLLGRSREASVGPAPGAAPALAADDRVPVYPDLAEVRGHEAAKRALEVAAAGGHSVLMVGPPGSGKTMLARRLPGILPPLERAESIAVTKIQSLVAEEPPSRLLTQRPFRCPHPAVSTAGMIGGGAFPRPGEVSLAHGGVLFLDELPEFRRDTLEALRPALEDREVTVVRSRARIHYPASFALLAAMAPCPCGHLGDPRHECRCTPHLVERFRARISRRILDRIDLYCEVPAVTLQELRSRPGEPSAQVAARVLEARRIQRRRFGETSTPINAAMGSECLRLHAVQDAGARTLMATAFERLKLSAGDADRILRVARTIADLDTSDEIRAHHAAEAISHAGGWQLRAGMKP